MGPQQMKSAAQLGLLSPPAPPLPPFPGAFVSDSVKRECGSMEVGFPMEQQPRHGWMFQGFTGDQGYYYMDQKSGQQGEGETHNGGRDRESGQSKLCSRGHWRPAEDAKLMELVSQHGPQNWNMIAEKLEGRSGKSCRLRWFNQLDPRINRGAFSEEEEEKLLAAHRLYGNKWAQIAKLFRGRTDNAVKNHWHVIMARKTRERSGGCKRRNPSSRNRMEMSSSPHIAYSGDSTSSSTRDGSASTCANLCLNSFTSRSSPPPQKPQPFELLMGSEEKLVGGRDGCSKRLRGSPMASAAGFDQSGCTHDSISEASAAKSLGTHTLIACLHGEAEGEREKISLPFIDFLGIGAI